MAGGVAGNIQDVERAIAEIVVRLISTNLEVIAEWRLNDISAFEVLFVEDRCALRKAWLECCFEARSHDEICRWSQPRDVA